jgi:SAM-dependent methyltransferase
MQAYGKLFARVYNRLWQDYANRIAPLICELYESTPVAKSHKTLLDVCCGTGQLSAYFLEKGYHVVGLDLSEGMLQYARENVLPYVVAKQARFIQVDAACFRMDETFGLVVSTYDSMNHLPDLDALQGCFRSTFNVLEDGGYFIFDLNTSAGLKRWNSINVNPGDEIFLLNRGIYDGSAVKACTMITGFVRTEDGLYERFDETVYNTVFKMDEVMVRLLEVGFRSAYFSKGLDLASPIDDPEKEGKVFLVAQK